MSEDLHKLFQSSNNSNISSLSDNIWGVIQKKKNNAYRLKIFGYVSLGLLSMSGSVFSIESLINKFSKLGFSDYFSLIFSDTGLLSTYWREYVLTLIESLPIVSLALSLVLIFIFFVSVERMTSQFRSKLLTS